MMSACKTKMEAAAGRVSLWLIPGRKYPIQADDEAGAADGRNFGQGEVGPAIPTIGGA